MSKKSKKKRTNNKKQKSPVRSGRKSVTDSAADSHLPSAVSCSVVESGCVLGIDPLAPIIVRSGRPFDGQIGSDAARFPPPSTIAGCLRTTWARQSESPSFSSELFDIDVAGPLLARPDTTGTLHLLVPKPADALYFGHGTEARCIRAEPRMLADDCGADLPAHLLPVQLTTDESAKPGKGPAWWSWDDLLTFRQGQALTHAQVSKNGLEALPGDRRTHVAISRRTGAALPGRLFQTEGLDLTPTNTGLEDPDRPSLRLLVRCAEPLSETLVHLGGERRLAALTPEPEDVWPACPERWIEQIIDAGGLTLTLLTPALFDSGYRPGWLKDDLMGNPPNASGLRLQLIAAAVDRWQPHSGWDLASQQPRPTRKLVPAGATYWFRLLDKPDADQLRPLWLSSVCDRQQDRRDGFGLALPAPWSPPPATPSDTKISN